MYYITRHVCVSVYQESGQLLHEHELLTGMADWERAKHLDAERRAVLLEGYISFFVHWATLGHCDHSILPFLPT